MVDVADEDNVLDYEHQKRWFSRSLAQMMVFLNGIILTITAYAAVTIFINGMIQDEYTRLTEETTTEVSKNISGLESSIRAVGTIITLLNEKDLMKVQETVTYSVPNINQFDRLFLLNENVGGKWVAYDLYRRGLNNLEGKEQNFYAYLLNNMPHQKNSVVLLSDLPGASYQDDQTLPLSKSRPFVLVTQVFSEGNKVGLLVGLTRINNIMDEAWLEKKTTLRKITIREEDSKRALYFMDRNHTSNRDKGTGLEQSFGFVIGSTRLSVEISAGKDTNTFLLEKTPWLVLIFGATLTLIGTLYVRNNQRQSYRLAGMNKALAQKNYELNSEVSERERLYQAMRKAERENRAIIDSVSDIIFETSIQGEVLFLNNTWFSVTRIENEKALNRNLFDLLHPQDQEEQRTNFKSLVGGQKQAYRSFTRLRTANGDFRSVELAVSMLRQDENKNMRVVGTINDVEERRRAERALSEAEKKYRTIVENAVGGIYQITPEGHILSANPAMGRILGYETPDQLMREVKNAHTQLYVNREERSKFIRELEAVGTVVNFETQIRKKDDVLIWINENARTVNDDDGNILYFEGSIEEITHRKGAEIKLREAKMHSDLASRAKSEFLANMSHELRTPLNAIIGFSEIIKDEILGPVGQRQYWEYANDIYESGKSLLMIINEILDVSKIEAGERHLNEGVIDVCNVVRKSVEMVTPKIVSSQLTITNLLEDTDVRIIGEELAIKQIMLNLLSNALKFTPAGGRITISHELDKENQLRISITDTGIGLNEDEIEKALTPFGQIETSLSRSNSGAGLGLTLVDSLMNLHGGKLELFSQKGIGTTATIIFPAKRVAKGKVDEGDNSFYDDGEESSSREYHGVHPPSSKLQ